LIFPGNGAQKQVITFDKVFDVESEQEQIFQSTGQQMVKSFLEGYNCSLFAYGQTGAGKTHTMMGNLNLENLKGL
jgi:kinesin family protein 11